MHASISIVMAARNAAAFIGQALSSLEPALDGAAIKCEVLLADGNSSDRTVEIASAFPRVRIVSRGDSGIYDGMNRALAVARGEYVIILNSDDMLLPESLRLLSDALSSHASADAASGGIKFGDDPETAAAFTKLVPLTSQGILFGVPAINARLFRRSFLGRIGNFRTDIGLGADRELMLRAVRHGMQGTFVGQPVYFYRVHTGSHTISNDLAGRKRIYESDFELARALLSDPSLTPRDMLEARAFLAMSRLKWRRLSKVDRSVRNGDVPVPTSSADFVRGIARYVRWRGVVSGY